MPDAKLLLMTFPARDSIRYTPLFCEENIWWLVHAMVDRGLDPDDLTVMFLSNPGQGILLACQRAADPGDCVIWDYHVVLEARLQGRDWIFDPATRLGFPAPRDDYLARTFPDQATLPEPLRTWVRRVPAAAYLAHFRSDRGHMRGRIPASAFPDYPIIAPPDGVRHIDLSDYRDMRKALADGSDVLPAEALIAPGG